MNYLWAFGVGGAICVVGQLLIDYTKLSPARILTGYVVAGVILSAVGLYDPLAKLAGAGASVPLLGFGHLLAQGGWNYRQFGVCPAGRAGGQKQGPELNRRICAKNQYTNENARR